MIINADAIQFAKEYEGKPFSAILTDPPYNLASITKRFGKEGSAPAKHGKDGAFTRTGAGFMGKVWDSDIAFQPETWEAFKRILYPGAFGMAFGGSRTSHRMATAIEEAGFIIHPMIAWVFGSGFPKATRIDTQIDKMAGEEREITKKRTDGVAKSGISTKRPTKNEGIWTATYNETKPATDLAKSWQGHRYGAQAMKPSMEPIIVFQKPYEGKPVENIIETGAGALNIEDSRIGIEQRSYKGSGAQPNKLNNHGKGDTGIGYADGSGKDNEYKAKGRWPANYIQSHSPQCKRIGTQSDDYQINRFTDGAKPFGDGAGHEFDSEEVKGETEVWECVEGCPVQAINEQSGNLGKSQGGQSGHTGAYGGGYKQEYYGDKKPGFGDKGGAGRFFHQSGWEIENTDPFLYQAKASKSERNKGLDNTEYETGHNRFDTCTTCGGTILQNPDRPSACKCDNPVREHNKVKGNPHPTVKPIALNQHLAILLLPPSDYAPRRIFIPFSGVASEMIGAMLAGWEEIVGVEMTEEYIPIAEARFAYWKKKCDEDRQQIKMF